MLHGKTEYVYYILSLLGAVGIIHKFITFSAKIGIKRFLRGLFLSLLAVLKCMQVLSVFLQLIYFVT